MGPQATRGLALWALAIGALSLDETSALRYRKMTDRVVKLRRMY